MRARFFIFNIFATVAMMLSQACGGHSSPPPPPTAPSITAQPSAQTVNAGQKATFVVQTANATTAQWRKDGVTISGATGFSYDTPLTIPADNGAKYSVVVTGPGGSVTSSNALLTVQYFSYTQHPQDATVVENGQVLFDADNQANPDDATHQWQRADPGSSVFADITGQTSKGILVQAISYAANNGAKYRRRDVHTTGTYYTNVATLSVSAIAPTIVTEPLDRTVQVSQATNFSLTYSGTTGTIQWFRKPYGGTAASISGATGSIYSLTPSDVNESGDEYYATVTNPSGNATTRHAVLTVTPAPTTPHFTVQPVDQTGHVGQSITFSATASGVPIPTYQWKKNGNIVTGETNSSLTLTNLALSQDADRYICVANNGIGGDVNSNEAVLHVSAALVAPSFLTQPADQTVLIGSNIVFNSSATGNPIPSGTVQELIGSTWTTLSTGYSLSLNNVQLSDSGRKFRFQATNSEGSANSNTATLTVNPIPTFSLTVNLGAGTTGTPASTTSYPQGTAVSYGYALQADYNTLVVLLDGSPVAASGNVTMNAAHTLTVSATINTFTLTYTAGANGSITGTASQVVNAGASGAAVTATPNANYHFVNWSDGSTANPRTDTNVLANLAVTANFAIDTYTISASVGANGSISPTGSVSVNRGSNQSYSITANTNYHVLDVLVDGSSVGAVTTYTFSNVQAAHTISATFAINTFTLTYTAGANGSITGNAAQTVNAGASGTAVTPVANANYHFVNWSDGSTANPRTDTNVLANLAVTANFALSVPLAPTSLVLVNDSGISGSDGITNDSTLSWNASVTATSYEVSVNGTTWTDVGNTTTINAKTVLTLSDGIYTFRVRAKNASGAGTAASIVFTLDTVAPNATNWSGVVPTNQGTAYTNLKQANIQHDIATLVSITDTTGGTISNARIVAGDIVFDWTTPNAATGILSITYKDAAGNQRVRSVGAPLDPVIIVPDDLVVYLDGNTDVGQFGNDNITSVNPNYLIEMGNNTTDTQMNVDLTGWVSSGITGLKLVSGLADGTHSISFRAMNGSTPSAHTSDLTVTIMKTAPGKVSESFPTLDTATASGSGTMTLTQAIPAGYGVVSAIFIDANTSAPLGGSVSATANGTTSLSINYTAPNASGSDVKIRLVLRNVGGAQATIDSNIYNLF
jgi:hypothetical protein